MIETSLAEHGYSNSLQSTGSSRNIEYEAFARVTRDLSNQNVDAPDFHAKFSKALRDNLKLWTILASDVANEKNGLSPELRSRIFYLAEFTRHHTAKIYEGDADAKVLIDINTMVMRGLRMRAENSDAGNAE